MRYGLPGVVSLMAASALAGCLGPASTNTASGPEAGPRTAAAVVIGAEQLWDRSGDLLSVMAQRVASMQVARQRSGGCPQITLRGRKSIQGSSDPQIYLDGQPAANTCILEMLQSNDVDRVEVYPMGVTQRPGYHTNPYGLILVFSRTAQ